jgi:hypothetical protein
MAQVRCNSASRASRSPSKDMPFAAPEVNVSLRVPVPKWAEESVPGRDFPTVKWYVQWAIGERVDE